jgi:hypothetical protein
VLEWDVVKVGAVVCMIVYLLLVSQSHTQQFIYFQF